MLDHIKNHMNTILREEYERSWGALTPEPEYRSTLTADQPAQMAQPIRQLLDILINKLAPLGKRLNRASRIPHKAALNAPNTSGAPS